MFDQCFLRRNRHVKDIGIVFFLMRLHEAFHCFVICPEIIGSVIELIDTSGESNLQLIIRDTAPAMQHKCQPRRRSMNRVQTVNIKMRNPLVEAMSIADCDSEQVNAGLLIELLCRFRLCIEIQVRSGILLRKSDMSDLSFDRNSSCMHFIYDHLRLLRIFLKRKL